MALTLLTSGTITLDAGPNEIASIVGPRVYVAAFDLSECDACTLGITWEVELTDIGGTPHLLAHDLTVDVAAALDGYLTPPLPTIGNSTIAINLTSGTPTGAVAWELYGL